MIELVRRIPWPARDREGSGRRLQREWLVTNGLGGYASRAISGLLTRRYHGFLIAALPAPLGRMVMLNNLSERAMLPTGRSLNFGGEEMTGQQPRFHAEEDLVEFRLETGLPVWRYEADGLAIEKHVLLPHLQNTVHVTYRLAAGEGPVRLDVRPEVNFRRHEAPVSTPLEGPYQLSATEGRYELTTGRALPPLRLMMLGRDPAFTVDGQVIAGIYYRVEAGRGYDSTGDLWSPGYFHVTLRAGEEATLVASTEPWEIIQALTPAEALWAERERRRRLLALAHPAARAEAPAELVLAADQFIITPAGRIADNARAHAAGDEVRTVIAGYHWFTDWGRDTMIGLEGLTLTTGRHWEAGWILRTFAHYIRDGLLPNLFPEGEKEGLYHTADATLWFFHAIQRYLQFTDDRATLRLLLPVLLDIIEHHLRGTRFGIQVDPADGLLWQGREGYQLTWMDAKVGDWVVTPRRGKAVEINALWYNALRLLERWVREERSDEQARAISEHADRARKSFNEKFWYEAGGYLYDVVEGADGPDAACRPNQLFALSLSHPVLTRELWQPVVEAVRNRLLTPVGLRSLSPGHPDYKPRYDGDLRSRDAAYHQGTVWAWLVGPFIDAWLKVYPEDRAGARRFLEGFLPHLEEACIGTVSEVFDAETPYTARGCVAQAWSVAEILRCWVRTAEGWDFPTGRERVT